MGIFAPISSSAAMVGGNAGYLVALIGTGIICYEAAYLLAEICRQKIVSSAAA